MNVLEAHLQYMISLGILGDSPRAEVCEGDEGAVDRAAEFCDASRIACVQAEDEALLAELLEVAE